jgi:uncharacterized integral membrane protein
VRYVYLFAVAAFMVLLLIFAMGNMESVTVGFLGWNVTGPLSLVIVAVYALGMVSGGSVLSFLRHSLHRATTKPERKSPRRVTVPPGE